MYASKLLAIIIILPATLAVVRPNNVGKLPALGWNNNNAFHDNYTAAKVIEQAEEIIKLGLKDLGYQYINIDDTWMVQTGRDKKTNQLIPNVTKFPDGITGFAKSIHDLGFSVGLYGDAGTETCRGYTASGSIGLESLDAKTFADWGIDYLKYDNCHVPSDYTDQYVSCEPDTQNNGNYGNHPNGTCPGLRDAAPKGYDWTTSKSYKRYNNMAEALEAQSRVILYSICNQGHAEVQTWAPKMAASWRISNDIDPYWYRIAQILNDNSFKLNSVDFYSHNDMDMLEVGNGNLTLPETRSHFAFWAAMKSPILIGTDLTVLASSHVKILKNKVLIDFNQDKNYGKPATPFKWGVNPNWTYDPVHPAEYWSGPSTDGTLVLLMNTLDKTAVRSISWGQVPGLKAGSYEVTDGWTANSLGCISGVEATLDSHDTAVLLVGAACSTSKGIFKLVSATFD